MYTQRLRDKTHLQTYFSQLTAAGPRGTSGSRAVSRAATATSRACARAQAPNLHTVGTTVRESSKRTATAVNQPVL